jgi:hypothetical protein
METRTKEGENEKEKQVGSEKGAKEIEGWVG